MRPCSGAVHYDDGTSVIPSHKNLRNRLLAALTPDLFDALCDQLEPVPLKPGEVLVRPGEPIRSVWFVESGIVSAIANTPEDRRIEIGLVGNEGFVGVPLLLGVDRTPHENLVQVDGTALRLTSAAFDEAVDRHAALRRLLLRYVHAFQIQTSQTALCNSSYNLEERLARWLTMCHDHIDGDEFPLTHEFLSIMLGVRRPGVTTTIHVLEGAGMIKARRSHIRIVDREKLQAAAGDSYGVAEAEYARIIEAALKDSSAADAHTGLWAEPDAAAGRPHIVRSPGDIGRSS